MRREQKASCHWRRVTSVAVKSLRKRAVRASMTMISVVLSIAFLTYVWTSRDIVDGLKMLRSSEVNALLVGAGVDLTADSSGGRMAWLVMLSLMVTSVGILNAMLMSVTERIKEIGTMKCIGATNAYIIRLFLVEAGIQGAVGTFVGILLGLLVSFGQHLTVYGMLALTAFPYLAGATNCLLALAIGVVLTIGFALYPAYMAANMLPVTALRVEE